MRQPSLTFIGKENVPSQLLMDKAIIEFIKKQTCANVCLNDENGNPYCFTCYYSFDENEKLLYFKTSDDSNHSHFMKKNRIVAGTILPDKSKTGEVRGLQFRGEILELNHNFSKGASAHYHLRFPFALAMKGDVFTIRLSDAKLTDSRLGFGKKVIWERGTI